MTLLQTESVIERLSQLLGLNLSDVLQKGLQAVEIRRRVKNRFDKEGIEIPFPQRTLHLGEADALLATLARQHEENQPT